MPPPYTATERGALALWLVAEAGRHGLTAVMLAERLGVSRIHAYRLLWSVSRVAPLYSERGRWRLLGADDETTDVT